MKIETPYFYQQAENLLKFHPRSNGVMESLGHEGWILHLALRCRLLMKRRLEVIMCNLWPNNQSKVQMRLVGWWESRLFLPFVIGTEIRLYSIRSLQFCAFMKWRTIHAMTLHWLLAAPHFHQLPTVGADEYITRHVQNFGQNPTMQTNICVLSCCHISGTNMKTVMMWC